MQKRIRQFCKNDPELHQSITLLTTLPGVGWITAAHAVARFGDWRELKNVRQIAGFLGLVSSEHSTGEKENRGPITRSGDSRLRNKIIQCAWIAINKDPELRAFYRSVYQRQPKKVAARKAIVAVARKLTTRMDVVLKEQRPYIIRPEISVAPLTAEETSPQGTTRRFAERAAVICCGLVSGDRDPGLTVAREGRILPSATNLVRATNSSQSLSG